MNNRFELWWKNNSQTLHPKQYYAGLYTGAKFKVQYPVLDIGGGNGSFLKYFNISKADIMDLVGKESLVGDYNFIKADITKKLPEIKKKYKTIFIMEVLEHLSNPLYLLANVKDYLADDGNIYISVPYTKLAESHNADLNIHVCRWGADDLEMQCRMLGYKTEWIIKRRRFKNTAFWLPHCFLVLKLTK